MSTWRFLLRQKSAGGTLKKAQTKRWEKKAVHETKQTDAARKPTLTTTQITQLREDGGGQNQLPLHTLDCHGEESWLIYSIIRGDVNSTFLKSWEIFNWKRSKRLLLGPPAASDAFSSLGTIEQKDGGTQGK